EPGTTCGVCRIFWRSPQAVGGPPGAAPQLVVARAPDFHQIRGRPDARYTSLPSVWQESMLGVTEARDRLWALRGGQLMDPMNGRRWQGFLGLSAFWLLAWVVWTAV